MITYNEGLPSLPDDVINEIFSLLDMEALKSCSLTGKALSRSTKPFIHRTLYLTPRAGDSTWFNVPGRWYDFKGLQVLGERGLLQYTRYFSIVFPYDPLFGHGLDPHIRHLHSLTNLRTLRTRWLDTPLIIPKMEEYFGAFFGSLQSLELDFPRGNYNEILYFACQFPNLRDLKIDIIQDHTSPMRNDGPHLDIKTPPPLDGTLDLQLAMSVGVESDPVGVQFILKNLATLPSGLKFRTLKLSWCTGDNLQPLINACAPTLESMEFTGRWAGAQFHRRENRPKLIGFDYQVLPPVLRSVSNDTLHSDALKSNQCSNQTQIFLPDGYPRRSRLSPRTCSPS